MAVLSGAPAFALLPLRARRVEIDDPLDSVLTDIARASLPRHLSTWAQRPETKLAPGHRIGGHEGTRYRVADVIDDHLVRAHDELLDRDVVIRFVDSADPAAAARAAARLEHEGISSLIDFEQTDDSAFFVMQAVEGASLTAELGGRLVGAARAVAIACEVADMVAHAHEHGVAHGRLDASCVVITGERRVCLVGFGETTTDSRVRSDVSAIAELLYAMLTDEPTPAPVAVPHHLALRRPDLEAGIAVTLTLALEGDIDAAGLRDRLEDALCALRRGDGDRATEWTGEAAGLSS